MGQRVWDAKLIDESYDDPFRETPSELRHLLPGFLMRRQNEMVELKSMLAKGDFHGIRGIAHKLKGSGAGYGFEQMSALAAQLEGAAYELDPEKTEGVLHDLGTLVKTLADSLP